MVLTKKRDHTECSDNNRRESSRESKKCIYLRHSITDNGKCDDEIKRRIEIARGAVNNISKVVTSKKISVPTRLRLIKCYVWSTRTYGAET